jgi:hypothetical protein
MEEARDHKIEKVCNKNEMNIVCCIYQTGKIGDGG